MPEAARSPSALRHLLDRAFPPPGGGPRQGRRPPSLVYGLNDRVPTPNLLALASQHAMLSATFLLYPILAATEVGLSPAQTTGMLTACALSIGIATILQCLRSRFGSGYLAVHIPSPGAIPLALQALAIGGLGLWGATMFTVGFAQLFVARLARPLRVLLPPEVCGVAVTMLGVSLAEPALRRALGIGAADTAPVVVSAAFATSAATLGLIVAVTVFAPRGLKLFAMVTGAGLGWVLAAMVGVDHPDAARIIADAPLMALPHIALPELRIEPALIPLMALLVLINLVDVLSVTVSLERLNDADWRRADMRAAQRAVTACGISNMLNGLTGGFQSGLSSSSVGLAFATQATARMIGIAAGALVIAIAFFPKVIVALTLIPSPVIGGILLYTSAYLVVAGMDLIVSRRLSERRVFMVGLSVLAGLSVALLPLKEQIAPALQPLFSTPLTVAACSAIILNILFRIGIARETGERVPAGAHAFPFARDFLEKQGDVWGARRDVIAAAIPTVAQALELVSDSGLAEGPVELRARFDEAHLDVYLLYDGEIVQPPKERPPPEALLGDAQEVAGFTAYMLQRLSDHVRFGRSHGRARIALRFDH